MKNRTSALAVIAAVLLIGCLLGIAGYHLYERVSLKRSVVSRSSAIPGHSERLADRLQLDDAQNAQLNAILEASRREIDAGMQAVRAKSNEKINAILNDEQKKKFQQILSEAGSHQRPEGRGHGHGGHEP